MRKILLIVLIGAISLSLAGCSVFLLGSGAVAGVGMSIDTVRLERKIEKSVAWDITKQTIEALGQITYENKTRFEIEAEVEGVKISAEILQVEGREYVWIDITARKKGLPDIDMANTIVDTINDNLKNTDIEAVIIE